MKIVLSIIIPVYNAETYLKECLDSVRSLTFKEWECILVDDGSKDSSGTICDLYSQNDERFRVIHKANGGVSSARNVGLENAKGEWVGFIDSDDWVAPDYASVLREQIDADAIHFGYQKENDKHDFLIKTSKGIGVLQRELFLLYQNYSPCAWSYFFRRNIIIEKAINFDKDLKYSEDTLFIVKYLLSSQSVYTISNTPYFYRCNDSSAVHTKRNYSHSTDDLLVLDRILDFSNNAVVSKGIHDFIFNFQFDNFSNALTFYTKILTPYQYYKIISQYRYYYRLGEKKYEVEYNKHNKTFFYIPIINMIYKNLKTWLYNIVFE